MTEIITDPLALIDGMLADNPEASYARRTSLTTHPPRILRLLSAEGEAYTLMRRDPAQTEDMIEYWWGNGAAVSAPPSFLLPRDAADVTVVFNDKPAEIDRRGWRLHVGHHSILLGDYYSGKGHPERKISGAALSPRLMRSFTNLLKTSQVMSIDNPQKMREWHDGIRMVIGIKKAAHERYTTAHPHDAFDF